MVKMRNVKIRKVRSNDYMGGTIGVAFMQDNEVKYIFGWFELVEEMVGDTLLGWMIKLT